MRENGFYWVKLNDRWTIARWKLYFDDDPEEGGCWFFMGVEHICKDSRLDAIGDKIDTPEKYR